GVLLAQRPGRRIARIGEDLLPGRRLPLVEREELGLGHVDLAAHLAHRRHVAALELVRDFLERLYIGGGILTFAAVAARRGAHQRAALVAQRHRQAVDLGLGGERERFALLEVEETPDAANEVRHVLGAEGIRQRQHWNYVPDLGKAARRRGAD